CEGSRTRVVLSYPACLRHAISRAARPQRKSVVADAGVAELVDARDLGSRDESRGGSNPSARTTPQPRHPVTPHPRTAAIAEYIDLSPWKSPRPFPTASRANSKSKCRQPISRRG